MGIISYKSRRSKISRKMILFSSAREMLLLGFRNSGFLLFSHSLYCSNIALEKAHCGQYVAQYSGLTGEIL